MERPKQQAIAFALGVLLAGGTAGFASYPLVHRDDSSIEGKRKAMYDDLDLAPAQRAHMDSVFDARNCQIESIFKPVQPALDSLKTSTREQINLILTPEQRTRLDARRRDDEARHDADKKRVQAACRR